jgi:hypothetical protein
MTFSVYVIQIQSRHETYPLNEILEEINTHIHCIAIYWFEEAQFICFLIANAYNEYF